MNKTIEDLMYHAGLTASGCWDEMDAYDRKAIVRFSQLIIAKCMQLCIADIADPRDTTELKCATRIKEYFYEI